MKITFIYGAGVQLPIPLISISYLSAAIKASGRHQVSLVDCFLKKDKLGYVLERIAEEKPDMIGFSVMSSYVEKSLVLAEGIKKRYPGVKIIFGGVHAILKPMEILDSPAVDAVCVGEAEETLVEYMDKVQAGLAPEVPGFWYKDNGSLVKNPGQSFIEDLDSLPFPDWDIWDMRLYMNSLMYLLGSRGCPFSCAYCCTAALRDKLCPGKTKGYYRVRSARKIVAEVKRNLKEYGFRGFQPMLFCDSIFGYDKEQFREFTDLYIKEGLDKAAPWKCLVVANNVDEEWARRAKLSGCFSVDMGLEHPDERFRMETLGKRITNADFRNAVTILQRQGIPYELYLLIGSRGENFWDALKNIWKARELKPLLFCINVYVPLPETRLWDQYETKKYRPGSPRIEAKESAFKNYMPLVMGLKLINQLAIISIALRLHGSRVARVFLRFAARSGREKGVDRIDLIRLFNHHIEQYYIYPAFARKIQDKTYPLEEGVFYSKKKICG